MLKPLRSLNGITTQKASCSYPDLYPISLYLRRRSYLYDNSKQVRICQCYDFHEGDIEANKNANKNYLRHRWFFKNQLLRERKDVIYLFF